MVRAWVALACGLVAVAVSWSISRVLMPRRPSSLASIRPLGPPPTRITSASSIPGPPLELSSWHGRRPGHPVVLDGAALALQRLVPAIFILPAPAEAYAAPRQQAGGSNGHQTSRERGLDREREG